MKNISERVWKASDEKINVVFRLRVLVAAAGMGWRK